MVVYTHGGIGQPRIWLMFNYSFSHFQQTIRREKIVRQNPSLMSQTCLRQDLHWWVLCLFCLMGGCAPLAVGWRASVTATLCQSHIVEDAICHHNTAHLFTFVGQHIPVLSRQCHHHFSMPIFLSMTVRLQERISLYFCSWSVWGLVRRVITQILSG